MIKKTIKDIADALRVRIVKKTHGFFSGTEPDILPLQQEKEQDYFLTSEPSSCKDIVNTNDDGIDIQNLKMIMFIRVRKQKIRSQRKCSMLPADGIHYALKNREPQKDFLIRSVPFQVEDSVDYTVKILLHVTTRKKIKNISRDKILLYFEYLTEK